MEELIKLLEGNEKKDEILGLVKKEISEKEESFSDKVSTKGRENSQLRSKIKAYDSMLAGVGIDVSKKGSLDEQIEAMSEQLNKVSVGDDDLKGLKAEVATLRLKNTEYETENKTLSESASKYKTERLKNVFQSALNKSNAVGYEDTMELMILKGDVSYDDADQIICKIGENNLPLEKGVETLIENGKFSVADQSRGGSGGGGAGGQSKQEQTFSSFIV